MEARYVPLIEASAETQMAIDEAIFKHFDESEEPVPTFRFFRFKPSAITLGYTQDVEETIDPEKCEEYGIPYVRRITGGGTVFHDYEGEITYSVVTHKMEGEIEDTFEELLEPLIQTLHEFGLDAKFKPYNDILVNKRKISGSAQKRGKKALLQHGTLMYGTDLQKLSDILRIDQKKLDEKGASSFLDLVTTMEKELGDKPDPDDLIQNMKKNYENYFEKQIKTEKLNEREEELADKLEDKYSSKKWLKERRDPVL